MTQSLVAARWSAALLAFGLAACNDGGATDPGASAPRIQRLWSAPRSEFMTRVGADSGGPLVLFGLDPAEVVGALSGATGAPRWLASNPLAGGVVAQAQAADTAYGAYDTGRFAGRVTSTGQWLFDGVDSTMRIPGSLGGVSYVAAVGPREILVAHPSRLVARDRVTGAERWRVSYAALLGVPFFSYGVRVADDTAWVHGVTAPSSFSVSPPPPDTLLLAIDLPTGRLAFSQRLVSASPSAGPADPLRVLWLAGLNLVFDRGTRTVRRSGAGLAPLTFQRPFAVLEYLHLPASKQLVVRDVATGTVRWSYTYTGTFAGVATCNDGLLVMGNRVRLLDPSTGAVRRYLPDPPPDVFDRPTNWAAGGDRFYVLTDSLYAFSCR
jgi:hypothetical protein